MDEEKDYLGGGMTICEAATWCCTCGKSEWDREVKIRSREVKVEEQPSGNIEDEEEILQDDNNNKQMVPAPRVNKPQINKLNNLPTSADFEDENENMYLIGDGPLPTGRMRNKRNCCMRIICLLCCCDTTDIGS